MQFTKGGAPFYLAPEIVNAKPGPKQVLEYDKNDIYAVGLVGLQLISEPNEWETSKRGTPTISEAVKQQYSEQVINVISGLIGPYERRPCGEILKIDFKRLRALQEGPEVQYKLGCRYFKGKGSRQR